MTQCPTSKCGLVERRENTKQPLGPVSLERALADPAASMAEQEVQTSYDPQTAVRGEAGDDEVIYLFTREAERTLPKEICWLLVPATQTKATEIAIEETKKRRSKTFEEMIPEWHHDYREVFKVEKFNEMPP